MSAPFSNIKRKEIIDNIAGQTFDLLVIGGGITGAGIALDAVSRGLNTALLEMQDFAAGTSSRSTKLVHGGLRYLKQFQVKVVSEVGKERAIVYENGPHVTTPQWMMLPIYKGGTFGKFTTLIGLTVYDFLAGVKRSERRSMLNREETLQKEPLLKDQNLKGGGYYVEYRTDDARLTIEVMKEAVNKGARAVNYTKMEEFIYQGKKVVGVRAVDLIGGQSYEIYAKKIVNSAGPWVDTIREKDKSREVKRLRLTKGVHLVIDQKFFPLRQAIYFDTPDGRMVFAIPRDGKTYVGTTDTLYEEDIVHPKVMTADRKYLITAINYIFPSLKISDEHVESSWVGVRPLIYEDGKNPSEISRKDEIWHSQSGLITIAGGKLTGYRRMAETVVDLVTSQLAKEEHLSYQTCKTKSTPISGGNVGGSAHFQEFVKGKVQKGIEVGFTKEQAEKLASKYGSNIDMVYELVVQNRKEAEEYSLPLDVFASLIYSIQEEMAARPADFFIRRTGALFFDINWVHKYKEPVIKYMAKQFGWEVEERKQYTEELDMYLKEAVVPADDVNLYI